MSFIEGVGDEVTAFFVVAIVLALATIVTFIGGGPSYYGSPTHAPTIPVVYEQQVVELSPAEEELNSENSNPNAAAPRPPDIGFREEVLSDQTIEPSAPTHNEVLDDSDDMSSSEDADVPSENRFPDVPEADLPQEEPVQTTRTTHEIRVRLKYLDDTERVVKADPKMTIREFKRLNFQVELSNNRTVRLIFCGHLLRDDSTLESYRVLDNSVLHVQVLQAQPPDSRPSMQNGNQDLDIGHMMWPLFSVILALAWLAFFRYPDQFTLLSTGILFMFTGGFIFSYSMRP